MSDIRSDNQATRWHRPLLLVSVAITVIVIDQLTKVMAFATEGHTSLLGGFIVFRQAMNPGAAFGVLGSVPHSALILNIITLITIIVLSVLFRQTIQTNLTTGCIALGLIYGGAMGNFIDRAAFGKVRDFLELHVKTFTWPSFNVADVGIVCGIVLLLVGLTFFPSHPPKPVDTEAETTTPSPPNRPPEESECSNKSGGV